jgi:hypothetical protein
MMDAVPARHVAWMQLTDEQVKHYLSEHFHPNTKNLSAVNEFRKNYQS